MIRHEKFQDIMNRDFGESFRRLLSCRTLSSLHTEIETISNNYLVYGYEDKIVEDENVPGFLKFRGDLFEIFAEVFFILNKSDNRVGIYEYEPVYSDDDYGVDGFGKNIDGLNSTIQVKFRLNPMYELLERDIKQFWSQSVKLYGVDHNQSNNMIIFTNCKGVYWHTLKKMYFGDFRVINGDFISRFIDNNEGFWNSFRELVKETLAHNDMDYIKI